jgi:hypothetical protein
MKKDLRKRSFFSDGIRVGVKVGRVLILGLRYVSELIKRIVAPLMVKSVYLAKSNFL